MYLKYINYLVQDKCKTINKESDLVLLNEDIMKCV